MEFKDDEKKELLSIFKSESGSYVDRIKKNIEILKKNPNKGKILDQLYRDIHSLKGSAGMIGLFDIEKLSSQIEDIFHLIGDKKIEIRKEAIDIILESMVKIESIKDQIIIGSKSEFDIDKLVSKLEKFKKDYVLLRINKDFCSKNHFDWLFEEPDLEISIDKQKKAKEIFNELSKSLDFIPQEVKKAIGIISSPVVIKGENKIKIEDEIKVRLKDIDDIIIKLNKVKKSDKKNKNKIEKIVSSLKKLKLMPLSSLFYLYPHLTESSAKELGKKISFISEIPNIELNKDLIELIKDPCMHMMRNAVDHGIEKPNIRKSKGKDETGVIKIKALKKIDKLIITFQDDGKGININEVKDRIIEKNLASRQEIEKMDSSKILSYLFESKFSTRSSISNLSGRGVGMNVIKKNIIEKLNGKIKIDSEIDKGTQIKMIIPIKDN